MKDLFFVILVAVIGAFCASSSALAGETVDPGSVDCCPIELAPGKIWVQFTKNNRAITCPICPIANHWIRGDNKSKCFSVPHHATGIRLWVGTRLVVSISFSAITQQGYKFGGGGYSEIIVKTVGDLLVIELSRE